MGFFSKVFGKSSPVEKHLEETNVPMLQMLMGMSVGEAKRTFSDMLDRAKTQSVQDGTEKLPAHFGDLLLQDEPTDSKVQDMLEKKRREGVKDDDIRWWWNMHDLERQILLQVDNLFRFAAFKTKIDLTVA